MNLDHLRYFACLAQVKHYTRAAQQLCISQPSLSHAIRQLEGELGVPLFEKTGRNTTLTPFGETFLTTVHQTLGTLEEGVETLRRSARGEGLIRLGFLQQNAFHKDDTCVPLSKQYRMMEIILYLYRKSKALVTMGMPMSVLKEDKIFDRVISIKYDIPNDKPEMFDEYKKDIDRFYDNVLERNG